MEATLPAGGATRHGRQRLAVHLLAGSFALLCVGYSVLAFDYFLGFAAGRDGLWLRLLAAVVSPEYAYGAGSVHVEQRQPYTEGLRFMLMHTTMGAVCLALGPFQFMRGVRTRAPHLHRAMGRVYLSAAVLSMLGGLAYLSITPLAAVYSGAPFGVALWALDLSVLATAWLAYAAIRRREIARHQAWMAMNFGLVLATPGLRLFRLVFGLAVPGIDQAQANLGTTTFLLPLCMLGTFACLALARR